MGEYLDAGWIKEPQNQNVKDTDDIENNTDISEIDIKIKELQKERYKLQTTKIEMNRNLRHDSRFELFYDNIKDAIERLPMPKLQSFIPCKVNNDEYLVLLSDVHFGSNFKSINNEYSIDICKQRFEILLSELIHMVQEKNISKINILGLSDDIQGILRISDLKLNEIPVVDAVVQFSRIMAQFLNELSAYCDIDYIPIQAANHSQIRPLGSKPSELATEDMEKVIANYIHDLLLNNNKVNVHIEYDKEYAIFKIKDFNCIAMHGHQIQNKDNAIKDLSLLHHIFFDYAFFGHDHSGKQTTVGSSIMNDCEVIVAESFIGSCPYSDRILKSAKAAVKVCKFTENGLTGTEKIILN